MDALIAPAHVWVPSAGIAGLLLWRGWLACTLGDARSSALRGYFLALCLAILLPVIAAVLAGLTQHEAAQWGPLILLPEPAMLSEHWWLIAALATPTLVFLLWRFLFCSADALAYAVAAGAGFISAYFFGPITAIAVALAAGGLIAFADRLLGEMPIAISGTTAFSLAFGYVYAGGGPAIPLMMVGLIGGLALALIAAGGKSARTSLCVLPMPLPAYVLAGFVARGSPLDLGHALPKPATGTYGVLLMVLCVFPAIAAPFAALSIWFVRRISEFLTPPRAWAAPLALVVELAIGLALSAGLTVALSGASALFNRVHEMTGGGALLSVSLVLSELQQWPFAGVNWWLCALLALPLLPPLASLLRCVTRLVLWLVGLTGVIRLLQRPDSEGRPGIQFVSRLALRVIQIAPSLLILFALASAERPIVRHYGKSLEQAGAALADVCKRTAMQIEQLSFATAVICRAGDPSCK